MRAFRAAYFRQRVQSGATLDAFANTFQRDWLAQIYLSALVARAEGHGFTLEQAFSYQNLPITLKQSSLVEIIPSPPPGYPDELTVREVEVLRLVAQGLSDSGVAERLVISPRTVQGHMRSIFNKINVNSRSAATRYAVEHKLV